MRLDRLARGGALLLLLGVAACSDNTEPGTTPTSPSLESSSSNTRFLILAQGDKLPADLAAQVQAAGGTLLRNQGKIGVASAVSTDPQFAAKLSKVAGIQTVAADRKIRWIDPGEKISKAAPAPRLAEPRSIGDDETFFPFYQWAPKAIHAPEAWDAGARGTGVRVAVLDGGLNNTHIDLNGSVDVAHSASFVAGYAFNQDYDPDGFSHATHVAGIIAARDNGIGTIGVAPGATIIGVKVLHEGSGSFDDVIAGIMYAATPISEGGGGANIINMSLGAEFRPHGTDHHLLVALSRATTYAYQHGVTVIVSAGNAGIDLDHTANVVSVPAQSAHVIAVSATAPEGYALGATDFAKPASYTDYGQSAITFAAPGGDFDLPNDAYVFDMVLSPATLPSNTGYFFAAGTSMAAPHVAGVAALALEAHPGLSPSQLESLLRKTADDLGKPGQDDYYGHGFINAFRAIQ
jgi:subtilisin family serine protease